MPQQVGFLGDDQLGGRRRRARFPIRHQVRERPIRRMTQGRDHRDAHRLDGANDRLLVEGHQLFEASASASHDHHVGDMVLIALAQGGDQAALGGGSLHQRRVESESHIRKPLPDGLLQVMNHRAARRGDQRDAAR